MSSVQITCKNIVYYLFKLLELRKKEQNIIPQKIYMYNKTKRKVLKLCILGQP